MNPHRKESRAISRWTRWRIQANKLLAVLGFSVVVGCSQTSSPPDNVLVGGLTTSTGSAVAARLQALYNDKKAYCGVTSAPAFLCSGVTLRVTRQDNNYHVWDPSPTSVRTGGVHVSYLRADSNFSKMAWSNPKENSNGYILYPFLEQPAGKLHLHYLCAFPVDAWGWYRQAPGCGPSSNYPTQSRACNTIGITTGERWLQHWNTPGVSPSLYQCGFDTRDAMNVQGAQGFIESLRAKILLGNRGFTEQNDLIIATWAQGQQNVLPIMAFFYIAGSPPVGLTDARWNQRDLYNWTNPRIVVPIIRVTLPTTANEKARFEYIDADQIHR
ncbi:MULTISPECIES: halovibrin HvnC [unclassified Pseudomonas]|uniref:halovibrin HvnC n=1 Tax=unclassified Pseudomonas TaxID=196821 RepID=UPI001EF0CA45|nr:MULTISPECIES: halovibrin HvnC [unclassified Pseudomonas]